jgi:hypothetical protein
MGENAIIPEWWTEFSQIVLSSPKLTQVVIQMVESEETAFLAEQLATDVTERRQAIDSESGLPTDEEYKQSTLSADLKAALEPLGIVIRPAKTERDDQSIIYGVGWILDYLAKQDLESGRPVEWSGNAQQESMMEYVLDNSPSGTVNYRNPVPLEAVIYTYAKSHATLSGKEVHVEVGDPGSFSQQATEFAETLYGEDHVGHPLPRLPQHRETDAWSDNYHDYAIVGAVHDVDQVENFGDLKIDIKSELKNWAAAAIELYVRDDSDEIDSRAVEDAIAERVNEFSKFERDTIHSRFGTRVVPNDDAIVFGLYCRHDVATGTHEAIEEVPSE